uniref:ATP synthase F0 subunit 8 n=1 Tax=Ceratina smaragdula TaxID=710033 RepID=UPI00207AFCE9|nr:ATP synthase F0 subunit 8 [Ceratina smaragdula]URX52619.1 ATP synthase F0 subunit 8 [Ceratina smaragdula]
MPQMKPMKWLYISLFIYLIFFMIMCLMNSFPLNMKFLYNNNYKFKKWNWFW